MLGTSTKPLIKIAIISAAAAGVTAVASAAEARTHHHYRGVPAAHRGGAFVEAAPPVYATPPVYPAPRTYGFKNDWQLRGRVPGCTRC